MWLLIILKAWLLYLNSFILLLFLKCFSIIYSFFRHVNLHFYLKLIFRFECHINFFFKDGFCFVCYHRIAKFKVETCLVGGDHHVIMLSAGHSMVHTEVNLKLLISFMASVIPIIHMDILHINLKLHWHDILVISILMLCVLKRF